MFCFSQFSSIKALLHQVWAKCYCILCVCVSLAGYQIQDLHQFLSLPSVQSGPRARRCGAGVRLLRTQWVTLTNFHFRVSHTHALTPSYILPHVQFLHLPALQRERQPGRTTRTPCARPTPAPSAAAAAAAAGRASPSP